MTSHRRRIQTRNRNFGRAAGYPPHEHNATIRTMKQLKAWRGHLRALTRATRIAAQAFDNLSVTLRVATEGYRAR